MLVLEDAFDHINFLSAPVAMRCEHSARSPVHQRGVLAGELGQGLDVQSLDQAGQPGRLLCIDHHPRAVVGLHVTQFHQQDAALLGERCMAGAGRILQISARWVDPVLVREGALQHQDFLAQRVGVRGKARARRVAHQRGGASGFAAIALNQFALHAECRRVHPG